MDALKPMENAIYNDRFNSIVGQVGDACGKRVGGGRVQMGLITFEQLAQLIIPNEGGFDKQALAKWAGQNVALERIFAEYRWPRFEWAITMAVIRKNTVDPVDGFIPLAAGSVDIEAGLNITEALHSEAIVYGQTTEPDPVVAKIISSKVGLVTEYGNGDSIELVVPLYVPGVWLSLKDTEFQRRAGIILVSPTVELYCEMLNLPGMSGPALHINALQEPPTKLLSVKTLEAMDIARQVCRELEAAQAKGQWK